MTFYSVSNMCKLNKLHNMCILWIKFNQHENIVSGLGHLLYIQSTGFIRRLATQQNIVQVAQ